MTYQVTITSRDGQMHTFGCGGNTDQEALIYAGKVVEEKAAELDPNSSVTVTKDGKQIGPTATVAEMTRKTI